MSLRDGRVYNAFISYSHTGDARLAGAIQSGLHRLAKPFYRLRALNVFRDKTSLAANPALWNAIQSALERSDYFILMASPASAQSEWVCRELGWWLAHREVDRLLNRAERWRSDVGPCSRRPRLDTHDSDSGTSRWTI